MKLRILNLAAAMVAMLYITSSCQKDPVQDSVAGQEQKQTAVASLTQGMETIKFSDGTSTTGKWINGTFLDEAQLKDLTNLENNPTSKMRTSKSWKNRISLCKKPFKNRKKIIYVDVSHLMKYTHYNVFHTRIYHFGHYYRTAIEEAIKQINGIGKLGIKFVSKRKKPNTWGDKMHTISIGVHGDNKKGKNQLPVFFKFPTKGRVGNKISFNLSYVPVNWKKLKHYKWADRTGQKWNKEYFRYFRGSKASIYGSKKERKSFYIKLQNYMVQGLLGSIGFQHADYKTYKSCHRYGVKMSKVVRYHNGRKLHAHNNRFIGPFPRITKDWRKNKNYRKKYNGYNTDSAMTACDPRGIKKHWHERIIIRRTYPAWRANACKNVRHW